ncbi:hypothetical protein CEXT_537501 [Caerostris extrusa]|uniref:Uncharacterized protein n=1 Tax=Caerostris extrusa TaxID=172846 RepID=A0AAV4QGI6_CAEEX|nr:hypothetical protein CEXT_537501 [Caerostris extrusa]
MSSDSRHCNTSLFGSGSCLSAHRDQPSGETLRRRRVHSCSPEDQSWHHLMLSDADTFWICETEAAASWVES